MRRIAFAVPLVAAIALMIGVASPAAAEDDQHYVPETFLPAIVGAIANHLGGSAPGSNDWDCQPTSERPRPVILVHGTAGNQSTNWQTFSPALANEGYCVYALTYGLNSFDPGIFGGTGPGMEASAEELRDFVNEVLAATGASKVDIIGHSQGSLMPNYYVKFLGGHEFVENYVGITPLWQGTQVAGQFAAGDPAGFDPVDFMPVCKACLQFSSTSQFIQDMREGGVAVPGVRYLNLMTQYDQLVIPYTSGFDEGMDNIVIQDVCPTDFADHLSIVSSPTAVDLTLRFLDPADERPIRCSVNLPALGVLGLGLITDPLQGLTGLFAEDAGSLANQVQELAATN